jgi:hypothetical protein
MSQTRIRHARAVLVVAIVTVLGLATCAAPSIASSGQEATFEDISALMTNPAGTLDRLRVLGVSRVRLFVPWASLAPNPRSRHRPRGFRAADPASYPDSKWAIWDQIVREAAKRSIGLYFNLAGGAPLWATAPGAPAPADSHSQWKPSAPEFGAFVHAVATRYSGNYDPTTKSIAPGDAKDLPPVDYWAIWNEPDYGPSLAPQGTNHSTVEYAPWLYRNLLDAAWAALQSTGHGYDTILFGELAPRGSNDFGIFSGLKPLRFLRALYCVDSSYRPLRGTAAAQRGCPTTASGQRSFARSHPALFKATGFADHPYSQASPPNVERFPDPDFTSLAQLGQLERGLDRLQRAYGSRLQLPIYLTEYGYITSPPKRSSSKRPYISPATAAYYLNWAEYIAWRNPRVMTLTQYLLADPLPTSRKTDYGGFASGLLFYNGAQKLGYGAYRLPLYLPVTTTRSASKRLEVWGCARPAGYAFDDTSKTQTVAIQFQRGSRGTFQTLRTVRITNPSGYFDVVQAFPASGSVRLEWRYPNGYAIHSRVVTVGVR